MGANGSLINYIEEPKMQFDISNSSYISTIEKTLRKLNNIIEHYKRENTRMLNEYITNNGHFFIAFENPDEKFNAMRHAFIRTQAFKNNIDRINDLFKQEKDLLLLIGKDKYTPYFMD